MALETYTDARIDIRSSMLTEEASITLDRQSGAQRVFTVPKGFAGVSPGARLMELTVDNAVPSTGFEYDPGDDMEGFIEVPLTIYAAGKTLTTTGYVESDSFKHAVNSEAMQGLKMVLVWSLWQ